MVLATPLPGISVFRPFGAAFLVCGASGLAAHLGFTAGVEETMLLPMLASKLLGGFLGVLLALLGTRGMYGSGNGGNADKKTC